MDILHWAGFVYGLIATAMVLALVFRIVEGRAAWDDLVSAFKAWPAETWANVVDYMWTRPQNRQEIRGEWVTDRVNASLVAYRRIEAAPLERAALAADPECLKTRERINKKASGAYAERGARKVLSMRARR